MSATRDATTTTPKQLADGLWRWTARHPEWHPGEFGSEVACFALEPRATTRS